MPEQQGIVRLEAEDLCETECVHEEAVASVKASAASAEELTELAELFKALSEPSRLRIISVLIQRELCVCDIGEALGMQQSAVSHQLRVLRNLRIVKRRKEGKMMYYSIDDSHIEGLFLQGLRHISHP